MDIELLRNTFASQLKHKMVELGYKSIRSELGAEAAPLASAAGVTPAMARRYLSGEALPDYGKLLAIAKWLEMSPSELLFGKGTSTKTGVWINLNESPLKEEVLEYIIRETVYLAQFGKQNKELPEMVIQLIREIAAFDGETDMQLKVAQLAFSSIKNFSLQPETEMAE